MRPFQLTILLVGLAILQASPPTKQLPTVLVALLVRNKSHLLKHTLALLELQDYPKERISLYIRSDHNEDDTAEILETWLEKHGQEYHSLDIDIDPKIGRQWDQDQGPLQWSDSRFQHIIDLKEDALEKGRQSWADWIWFLDADAFLTHPRLLREMVAKEDMTVVAPMLKSVGLYSNFWAGMTENYYYKRTDEYKPILERKKKGCFPVPMVHSSVFINLNHQESLLLTFLSDDESIPQDDIIRLALSAAFNDIKMHICNDHLYGYIMLPLEDTQNLQDDQINLSNLLVEMFAYGHTLLHYQKDESAPKDSLGVDQVYLINLDRRPDRRRNMELVFNELHVDYHRVRAVDGKIDVDDDYIRQNGIDMMVDFSEPYHDRPLTFGEIGCFMSHYNIWLDMLDHEFKEIIVFEDDIRFEPFFRRKLAAVRQEIKDLKLDWDLIFLGRKILPNVEENWVEGSQWLVHVNYTYWTLGYMLSQSGAQKLVKEQPLNKMVPVDEYLPIMYDRHPNETWKRHYSQRNLLAFSVHPLLLFPTHYTGEEGYISDTENTPIVVHDEL